jgi:hypothetical protein
MLQVKKSQRHNLVALVTESNKSVIFDGFNSEVGKLTGMSKNGWYFADFQNGLVEVVPPSKCRMNFITDEQWNNLFKENSLKEIDLVENPFGSWIADKAKGVMKRRTAKKALGRRLKAESSLSKARKAEADAIKAATKNPFDLFGKKKQFYVDFWGDGEFHQTVITARNKAAAIKIAGEGYRNFRVTEAQEVE